MLRIKEDVDLKELKNFGFVENENNYNWPLYNVSTTYNYYFITIPKDTKEIHCSLINNDEGFNIQIPPEVTDCLYTLFTLNFVEQEIS